MQKTKKCYNISQVNGGNMAKKEKCWIETLSNQDTILIKKSYLLSIVPKISDKEIERVLLNILKSEELNEETKSVSMIEISIGVLKMFMEEICVIPAYAYVPSENYYQKIFEELSYEEREQVKEGIVKTCNNCMRNDCGFYKSSSNPIICQKWHNAYLIGKEYVLKKQKMKK